MANIEIVGGWNRWDVHPSVVIGLVLLGGLYVFLGGLSSARRHVASFCAALRNHNLHIVQHLVFLTTAVIMWWPVLSPVPELPRIPHLLQMLYLFLLGIPMSITGALITLSDTVLYPFYAAAPRVGGFAPLDDQQIGGLLMWVLGGLMLWIVMTVIWWS